MQTAPLFVAAFVLLANMIAQEAVAWTPLTEPIKTKLVKWVNSRKSIISYAVGINTGTKFVTSTGLCNHGYEKNSVFHAITVVGDGKDKLQFTAEVFATSQAEAEVAKRKKDYPSAVARASRLQILGTVHVGGTVVNNLDTQFTADDITSVKAIKDDKTIEISSEDPKFRQLVDDGVPQLEKSWKTMLDATLKDE